MSKSLNLSGNIILFTESNVDLCDKKEDRNIIKGEHYIAQSDKKIKKIFLTETKKAGLIDICMGSLYISALPCLMTDKLNKDLDKS